MPGKDKGQPAERLSRPLRGLVSVLACLLTLGSIGGTVYVYKLSDIVGRIEISV